MQNICLVCVCTGAALLIFAGCTGYLKIQEFEESVSDPFPFISSSEINRSGWADKAGCEPARWSGLPTQTGKKLNHLLLFENSKMC